MFINKRFIRSSVVVFYLLIGLEIIIMISPFAAYFYAVYGPVLNFLYDYKITAWLAGFFLPHAVFSKSMLLNFLNGFGRGLFSLGLIFFLLGAFQIYSAKLRRKPMVTGILYRWIRHPQYLFLAITGLGLLLFWPRFIILILYVSILFVYYMLARYEEQKMLEEHGDDYRNYMHRTGMFLPFEPGRKIYALLFGWIKSPGWALASSYAAILTICVALAFGLRSYTISQTSMVYLPGKQLTAISTMPKSEPSMKLILDNAYQQRVVTEALTDFRQEGHKGFLVHMMPRNYMMQGLFAQPSDADMGSMRRFSWRAILGFVFPFIHTHNHHTMAGASDDGKDRMIFSQLSWPNRE